MAEQYTRKRERTRAKLLAAATSVLARDGLDGATIGAIADEAGVVAGTVYHHFSNRETLVEAVIDEIASSLQLDFEGIRSAEVDPAGRVALAAVGLVDRAVHDRRFAAAFGHLVRRIPELSHRLRSDVEQVVKDGLASGRFTVPGDVGGVPVVVDALLGIAANAALAADDGRMTLESRSVVAQVMLSVLGLSSSEAETVAKEAGVAFDRM